MKKRLLESGLRPKGMAVPLRRMRTDSAIYRPENLALRTKCEALEAELQRAHRRRTFDWDGEKLNQAQVFASSAISIAESGNAPGWALSRVPREPEGRDRPDSGCSCWTCACRWRATRASRTTAPSTGASWPASTTRRRTAKLFHDAIARVVVPAVQRLAEKRRRGLSLDTLRMWDDFWHLRPDPLGRPPLKPFELGR